MPPQTELPVFERFAVERRLGSGGFGVVYEAFDRKRNIRVALKTIRRADPSRLYHLKQEFRALAGIVHPNLVTLYELMDQGGEWFLTMELVEGVPFVDRFRTGAASSGSTSAPTLSLELPAAHAAATAAEPAVAPEAAMDYDLLRDAILQVARGLGAIHDAGKLHHDIKPSNVLVEKTGRVVVLDFGLVTDEDTAGPSSEVSGTPAYMAPEQKAGRPEAASDWFAVGVMLYQALAGRLPPPGPVAATLDASVPADLAELCLELLNPNPQERAGRARVLRALSRELVPAAAPSAHVFVGRAPELAVLHEAFRATAHGKAVAVRIRGASGIGKSALARQFRREIRNANPDVLALSARCFDRESVRYKALDGVVDGITRFLRPLPAAECAQLLPRDIAPLARLFPVLRRVEAVAEARRRAEETADAQELRRRAFVALREMLARIAAAHPVVIFIDDLQWSDLESVPLLETILREPDSPALLLVPCYRDEVASNPVLQRLGAVLEPHGPEIVLSDLSLDEAREVARSLAPESAAEEVAREAGGNPFLIDALLRHGATAGAGRSLDLEEVICRQVADLPEKARALVETLAVAGRPVPPGALGEMADASLLPLLVSERLVRSRGAEEELEIYHDRIRETVAGRLPAAQLRDRHLFLARAFSALPETEPETVALHFEAGGEIAAAAPYAEAAADDAVQALAFERAARLYRLALESPHPPEELASLRRRLGNALSDAGHALEAAEVYRQGAETAGPAARIDLLRLAAERLLVSGRFDEGYETMRGVLGAFGMDLARTPGAALRSLLWRRAWLRLRGLRFHATPADRIDPRELLRIDACHSAVGALGRIDPIRGMDCQARLLMRTLRAGEPARLARCLALEVVISGFGGDRAWTQTVRALRLAERMVEQTGDEQARYSLAGTSALAAFFRGRWSEALAGFDIAEHMKPPSGSGSSWEVTVRRLCTMFCWFFSGDLRSVLANLPGWLSDCQARADLYTEVSLLCRCGHLPLLAADHPEGAADTVTEAIRRWSQQGYHWQHVWALIAHTEIDLYRGRTAEAWERVEREWPSLRRSLLLKVQFSNIEMRHLRSRAALAQAAADADPRLCRIAFADAAALEREDTAWSIGMALLLRAGAERLTGKPCDNTLRRAEVALTDSGTLLYAAAAKRCRGELTGDIEAVRTADEFLAAQGVRHPARMTRVLAPGLTT